MRRRLLIGGLTAALTLGFLTVPLRTEATRPHHAAPLLTVRAGHGHVFSALRVEQTGVVGLPLPVDVPLAYHGGAVQQAGTTTYAIFWEPPGSSVSPTYHTLLERYFQDVGGSALYGIAGQYYQTVNGPEQQIVNTSAFGGAWVDTRAYPGATLQDGDLRAEVQRAMQANHWSGGLSNEFFVFTARGEQSCLDARTCSFSTFCGYHNDFSAGGQTVLYADMPYAGTNLGGCGTPSSPNGDLDADSEINIASHEQIETVTDPVLDAWSDPFGQEIADKCAFTFGPTDSSGADTTMNGHPYIVQEEYSNRGALAVLGGCSLS